MSAGLLQVDVGDLVFDVRTDGPEDGPPVLLLHGFPETSLSWSAVTPLLAEAGLRTYAPDQLGYSPGARPGETDAYALPALAAVTADLMTALDLPTADVVGHDWGANVAWAMAAWHPDRVRTLTAVSVPHPTAYTLAYRADPEQMERSAYIKLFWQRDKAERVLLEDDARRLRRILGDVPPEAVEDYVAHLSAPGALTAALDWYRAMSSSTPVDPVDVPTTYVWSDQDMAVGRTAAEACADQVTGDYRFVELAGVSHWIPETAPASWPPPCSTGSRPADPGPGAGAGAGPGHQPPVTRATSPASSSRSTGRSVSPASTWWNPALTCSTGTPASRDQPSR